MRIAIWASPAAALLAAAPAAAQDRTAQDSGAQDSGAGGTEFASADPIEARPGSPSSGTSTVSPSTVPQNMDRLDEGSGDFALSIGSLYADGDFGTNADTSIWSTAVAARYRTGDLRLTASIPYMRIRSNAVIFTGIDSTPVLVAPGTRADRRTADGFGDLTLGATYTIDAPDAGVEIELSGRVKLDTAERSSGLTSGEKDYALGVQVTKVIGRVAPFASLTYRFLGDNAAYDLKDGVATSAGASVALGGTTYLLASYHFSERATRLVRNAHELFAGIASEIPGTRFRLTGFGTAGLSAGAAGVSAGLALSRSF